MEENRCCPKEYKDLKASRTRSAQIIATIAILLFVLSLSSKAQNENYIQSNASLAEKVYLQLDGKVYTTGNIVWFKSIVSSAYSHIPTNLSGVLYVELIRPDETILETKLIKLENGIGQGFFYLDKTLSEGLYLIRAYTQWNKNFETDFFFEEYIRIFAPKIENAEEKPISNVTLINEQPDENRLEACFAPLAIDSLHKSKLTVIITLDNRKDTVYVKKGKDNKYWVDYDFAEESQFATLQMQTSNNQRYSTTIILNNEYIDLQFFPESGELVHGLRSKIGFKALDASGQGKIIQGDIIDEKDSVLTSFKSNVLGMGSFFLNKIDSNKTYFARLKPQLAEDQISLYRLPAVSKIGNVLSINKHGDNVFVTALSNYMKNDSIYLSISYRGVDFYDMKVKLKDGIFRLLVPVDKLPEGIISCIMMDTAMRPVAERLYFNERPESRINIALSTNKNIYAKRELTKLSVEPTNSNGEPVNANLSLLVINKQQMGKMQQTRQNILSCFLLNSELKGQIENPGFYFRKDSSMHNDLDALMLTQGWRKYNYSKPYKELTFQAEPNLSVTGHVSGVFSKRKRKKAELTMLTFGNSNSIYNQVADSLGKFNFNLGDEYGQKLNILIQSSNRTGKKMNYTISLDKKESPPVSFNHVKTVAKLDSVVQLLAEKNLERKKIDDAFPLQSGNILLDEVEVTAYHLTPNRKKVMNEYGKPTEVIDGKEILEKEEKWSYGLYSVLLFNYPEKVRIVRNGNGDLYAKVVNGEITLVVIDGIPVRPWEYPFIPNIPPSEVSSFEIIEYAKNFSRLYCEVFPENCRYAPAWGNVIAIYTYGQKGIYGANKPVGIMQASVPVFSAPREFYAPKYENPRPDDWNKPDLRALIHWEPILKTDSLGKASASFYNADNIGKMMVVVEAISTNGEIGYQELEYEIEGAEKEIIIVK